jgi:hypothetical protein
MAATERVRLGISVVCDCLMFLHTFFKESQTTLIPKRTRSVAAIVK